ncbi:Protein of unknown function [Limimonas halophila]|uniref:DUF3047 domain-containing protein n=1 Tax=Limimonas halophila TaxID=1082479 RepID=A0A1G7TVG5_9PROT|nr:DUF3047 domain-containing protein [Limimonas halophila]SDG39346.1 Protein of unknown function [Limimonas halophila]
MRAFATLAVIGTAAVSVAAPFGAEADGDLLDARGPWEKLTVPSEAAARFDFRDAGTVRIAADEAVGFLYRPVRERCGPCARVRWSWRVDEPMPPSDQGKADADDRALAVHLWFDTGNRDKTLRGDLAALWGYPTVTHAITYVWGGVRPAGTFVQNPYYDRGKLVILRESGAATGRWRTERRDLAADIRRAFGNGVSVADLEYVAVSADTDNTDSQSRGRVRGLRLAAADD